MLNVSTHLKHLLIYLNSQLPAIETNNFRCSAATFIRNNETRFILYFMTNPPIRSSDVITSEQNPTLKSRANA